MQDLNAGLETTKRIVPSRIAASVILIRCSFNRNTVVLRKGRQIEEQRRGYKRDFFVSINQ